MDIATEESNEGDLTLLNKRLNKLLNEILVREENSTSILSDQDDDIVLEHVERELFPRVRLKFNWRKSCRRWKKFQAR